MNSACIFPYLQINDFAQIPFIKKGENETGICLLQGMLSLVIKNTKNLKIISGDQKVKY